MSEQKALSASELKRITRDYEATIHGDIHALLGHIAALEAAARKDACDLHGYTIFAGPCVHGRDPWDRCDECGEETSVHALMKVRAANEASIAALEADNAALLEALGAISTVCETKDLRLVAPSKQVVDTQRAVIESVHATASRSRSRPHPGAALLEEHRKALVRARNDGLEKAAQHFDIAARNFASFHAGTIAEQHALAIRALKEPEQ